MDQRNAGRSAADVKPDHGWHTFAADHLALMDHLGFKKFHVLGGCIGGSYCFEAIEQAPDRVAAAVYRTRSACGRTATAGTPRSRLTARPCASATRRSARRRSTPSAGTCSTATSSSPSPATSSGIAARRSTCTPHRQAASGHTSAEIADRTQHRGAEGLARAGVPAGLDSARARLPGKEHARQLTGGAGRFPSRRVSIDLTAIQLRLRSTGRSTVDGRYQRTR